MALSQKQISDVCMRFSGDYRTCRYLSSDDDGKFYCFKLRPIEKNKIDNKIKEYAKDCRKKGIDIYSTNVPLGSNCSGYLILKNMIQGYDQ